MIRIRDMESGEFLELMECMQRIFPERANFHLFLELYEIFPEGFVVALDDEKIIGFAIGVLSDKGKGRILLIGVDENYRCRGIGTRLLKKLLMNLRTNGAVEIELEVRVSNKKAIEFYQRNGFVKIRRVSGFYEDGEDGYIMVKKL